MPITLGFLAGALFVFLTDWIMPENYLDKFVSNKREASDVIQVSIKNSAAVKYNETKGSTRSRQINKTSNAYLISNEIHVELSDDDDDSETKNKLKKTQKEKFRKILLLIIAVTIHNIPEGLAVGVGFGAIGKTKSATLASARNLALGIGLQNFPEGLAVSLPLYTSGFSLWKSFWYGQLSGMVEPIAGIIGAFTVNVSQTILPYALSFAAGAMIFVVVDNLLPEASTSSESGKLSSWSYIFGFCLMMCLDVGLG